MIDRRVIWAIAAVVLAMIGGRSAFLGSGDTDETERPQPPVSVSPRSSSAAASNAEVGTRTNPAVPRRAPTERNAVTSIPLTATPSDSSTVVARDLADLVAAARPTLPPVAVVDDGHRHRQRTDLREDVAARVIVAAWSWRFDDPIDRSRSELEALALPELIDALAPTAAELARRVELDEVAWVVVREVELDGSTVVIVFDHHVVSSTSPETVRRHRAAVTIADGLAVEVVVG